MRIIGGTARGHQLEVPKISDLRPSQDIVRESIFNILGDISGMLVLDLYAGTGALGIEALSRGAKFCDFVEKEAHACKSIEKNLNHTKLLDHGDVYCEKAISFLNQRRSQQYQLVFLDPPYVEQPRDVLLLLPSSMSVNGILIYLHGGRVVLTNPSDQAAFNQMYQQLDQRTYGATHLSIWQKRP